MFGTLKNNILSKLENTYNVSGENAFKEEFYQYIKVIKENKVLKEFYTVYDLFNQVSFDDSDIAKEFVEESISYLKKFDKSNIKKLESLTESKDVNKNTIEFKLDQLVFNESIGLKDKATYKIELIKQLTKKDSKSSDYKEVFTTLHKKINDKVSQLNPEQTKALDIFIENDNQKITTYYDNLINETHSVVENKILQSEDMDVIKKLIEVKKRLDNLKSESPSIAEIEKIIALKESFI